MKEIYLNTKDGYVFNTESKQLEKCELIGVIFTLSEESPISYACKLGGVETTIIEDQEHPLWMYLDEEHYKTGHAIERVYMKNTIQKVLPYTLDEQNNPKVWVFEMGEAKQICAKDILMRYTFKDGKCEVMGIKCYESREDVYRHNDFIVKEDDGSERLVECIASKMKLTEEQCAIIKELEDVLQRTKDVGLRLFHDEYNETLWAYNVLNTEQCISVYSSDAGDYSDFERVDDFGISVKSSVWNDYCDNSIMAKIK